MKKKKDAFDDFVAFNLRLRPRFKASLKQEAEKNNRSLHAEIIHRLSKSFKN